MNGFIKMLLLLFAFILSPLFGREARAQTPAFPLKASANKRYLVDQNGVPFFMLGDGGGQSLASNVSTTDATTILADRVARGFNAVWIHITIDTGVFGRANKSTYDGILPFTGTLSGGQPDLSTPNPSYFARVDAVVNAAAAKHMVVLLDILENYSDLVMYRANGNTAVNTYGQFLGNRYKSFPNIIWIAGNDFQTWEANLPGGTTSTTQAATDNGLAQSIMRGVLAADTTHLMTEELNYNISGSTDDTLLSPLVTLYSSYTYYPAYGEALAQYNASTVRPVYTIETYYEDATYGLTPPSLDALGFRKQAYWTALWGGLGGYFHGNQSELHMITPIGSLSSIDTATATYMENFAAFIKSFNWWLMIPDQTHTVVTAGFGTATGTETGGGNGSGRVDTDAFVTTSRASDGSFVLSYTPVSTTLTVDMTKLQGSATAQWYDPTSNRYTAISGSPFTNTGTHNFTTPGNNSAGAPDWALVLQSTSSTAGPPAPPTGLVAIAK